MGAVYRTTQHKMDYTHAGNEHEYEYNPMNKDPVDITTSN
jgi:hypothetical protein